VDDRLAAYGYETNTGVKFVVVVDMRGRRAEAGSAVAAAVGLNAGGGDKERRGIVAAIGLRDGELRPVSYDPQAYAQTLCSHLTTPNSIDSSYRYSKLCKMLIFTSFKTHSTTRMSTIQCPAEVGRK
jgi:hypothetical protein